MTNRVCLGQKGSDTGIWVSKPGVNVLTAGEDDMLLSTSFRALQIIASGVISSPANLTNYDRTIPNLGFQPIVLIGGNFATAYSFPNATTLRIRSFSPWMGNGGSITWAVTNQPILH